MSVADPVPACMECGGEVKKVFHPTPIIFKGSGWHVTDYGRNGAKSSSSSALSDTSGTDSKKTESESSSKAEATAST
jgi:predicted nucleic acid-binding Zn ribbon protein